MAYFYPLYRYKKKIEEHPRNPTAQLLLRNQLIGIWPPFSYNIEYYKSILEQQSKKRKAMYNSKTFNKLTCFYFGVGGGVVFFKTLTYYTFLMINVRIAD